MSRCQRTSQATVSVSASVRPSRGQSAAPPRRRARCGRRPGPWRCRGAAPRRRARAARRCGGTGRWRAGARRLQLAFLDPGEQADRPDRMLVDRVMMVHVELHLGDDPAEIGNEAAEHAGLVHPPQHRLRIARAGQDVEEQGVGLAGRRAPCVDQLGVAGGGAHRQRVDFEPVAVGEREHAGSAAPDPRAKKPSSGSASRPRSSTKPSSLPGRRRKAGRPKRRPLPGELLVEMGEEDPGQVADRLRVQEIVAHEALDRRFARPVGVAHPRRDLALIVEGEPLLGAAGDEVEVAAHRPQEALGALELAQFGRARTGRPRPDRRPSLSR